jgi:hypothetical protein
VDDAFLVDLEGDLDLDGTPRGPGRTPTRSKMPSVRLSLAISRSPWSTWTRMMS